MNLNDKLFKIKYVSDNISHLTPNTEKCKNCSNRTCTFVCPAQVWEWNEEEQEMTINYENCLECGACRIACTCQSIKWEYPKGNKGVTFKQG